MARTCDNVECREDRAYDGEVLAEIHGPSVVGTIRRMLEAAEFKSFGMAIDIGRHALALVARREVPREDRIDDFPWPADAAPPA